MLARGGLCIRGGELIRFDADGEYLLRLPLNEILSVEARRQFDTLPAIGWIATAVGIAAIGWYLSEYHIVSVIIYVVAALFFAFPLVGAWSTGIVIRTCDGEATVSCVISREEAECFVISLRRLMRTRIGAGEPHRSDPDTRIER